MIRYSEKNGNKKNHAILRETILALVARHPRYPNDLYNACVSGSTPSRTEFRQLLSDMRDDGDIRINANNLVLSPKPTPEVPADTAARTPEPPKPTNEVENPTDTFLIHCLVNRSLTLKHPKQKKSLKINGYYAHRNYKITQIPLDSVCEETLLKGFQLVPGEFIDTHDTGIRNAGNWVSQKVFLIEFDDTTESTLAEFIAERPFLRENAWLVTESIRSRYDDPDDAECNGQLRPRLVFCMPRTVKTIDERDWIYDALVNALPGCDDGSANSFTNGGLGNASAEHVKIGKIVDTDWFNTAIATGQQKQAERKQRRTQASRRTQTKASRTRRDGVHRARGRTSA